MKRHASMNRIYRLVWNASLGIMVAVAENAKGRGKSVSGRKLIAAALALTCGAFLSPFAMAGPAGGQVVSGTGNISQSGATTNIQQTSQNLSVNWQSFNVAASETVNFLQPSATAIAVNRIFDTNGSQILGHLNANGQIYLINPNGIIFGAGAQVNVGGMVASTLDIANSSNGKVSFAGSGTGSIINQGTINAANGGYVAFIGNTVSNAGAITAPMGAVGLGAGNAVTLTFAGNSLVHMQVDQSTLNNLAANGGLIQANGGMVILTAGARDALLASVVNNTGIIEAQTVNSQNGMITLLGGMTAGTVNVGGTLDASAPNGGSGGFIETSAHNVHVAPDASITTAAASGLNGSWLIDPVDFTIAATGGDITGTLLGTMLGTSSVTIQTGATGTNTSINLYANGSTGTAGDINVNDAVNWSANTLTLNAWNNININAAMNATGTAGLALLYGQSSTSGSASTYNVNASVNLASTGSFSTQLGSTGTPINYTIITSLGATGSTTATDLQGINGNLTGNYVLGANIDASGTSTWNSNAGFAPIGNSTTYFSGIFEGLGHTISNLSINLPTTNFVGLFGYAGAGSVIRNVGLIGGSITGQGWVGALVGDDSGAISNSYATVSITGINSYIGGLVGAKHNGSTLSNSYSAGSVSGGNYVGGLVGFNDLGTISNSYAAGSVSGVSNLGGLIGGNYVAPGNFGSVSNSYATGRVTGSGTNLGALVGNNLSTGTVINNFWDSTVNPTLAGIASGATTGATGLTTVQMQTAANFTGFVFTTTPGATGNNWVMVDADGTLNNAGGALGATRPMLASEYSTTINNAHQLQLMAMAPAASYSLGSNINAAATALSTDIWGSAGFVPVGNSSAQFTGTFDGLGNTISSLYINSTASNVGMFGYTNGATISNIGLIGGSVTGGNGSNGVSGVNSGIGGNGGNVGALVGYNSGGMISNSYATVNVSGGNGGTGSGCSSCGVGGGGGAGGNAGELVGYNTGVISNSYATGNVSGGNGGNGGGNGGNPSGYSGNGGNVGGLAGHNSGTISNSYATGIVNGGIGGTCIGNYCQGGLGGNVGGLAGYNIGAISNSYATGSVSGSNGGNGLFYRGGGNGGNLGGLTGYNSAAISNSYATGSVIGGTGGNAGTGYDGGTGGNEGGLAGYNNGGAISNSYATGSVNGGNGGNGGSGSSGNGGNGGNGGNEGGLAGYSNGGSISNSYAVGSVVGGNGGSGGSGGSGFMCMFGGCNTGSNGSNGTIGGLLGKSISTISNSFYDNTVNSTLKGIGSTTDVAGTVYGMSTADMKLQANFTSATVANGNVNSGWDFTTTPVWGFSSGVNAGYPILCSVTAACTPLTTTIYLDLLIGSSLYGSTPTYTYGYYTTATYGFGTAITDATPTGSVIWGGAPTATSNVGSYSMLYSGGINLGNSAYTLSAGNAVNWSVTARPLNLSVSQTYNGSPSFSSGFVLAGMVNNNAAPVVSGSASASSANVGTYTSFSSSTLALNNANYTLTGGTVAASISPASLTYVANPASFTNGQTPSGLTGSIAGFVANDTLGNATTGILSWVSAAGSASQPGLYAIDGAGLSSLNYSFTQSLNNLTALTLRAGGLPETVQSVTTQFLSNTGGQSLGGQSANSNANMLASNSGMSGASSTIAVLPSTTSGSVTNTGSGGETGGTSSSDGTGSGGNGGVAFATITLTVGGTGTLQIVNGGIKVPDNLVSINQ